MTVSKAFWKIALKNIGTIITYTVILIMFGTMNINSGSTTTTYEAEKPSVVIFNHDEKVGVTKSFIEYLEKNTEIKDGYQDDDRLKDALFYEDVTLAVDIPENFHQDIALGRNPEIRTRSSAGYAAELAKVVVNRYLTVAQAYSKINLSEVDLTEKIDKALETSSEVEIKTAVDTAKYSKPTRYFSFANYTILACVITIICLIMSSFNRLEIRKRNLVSKIELKRMNMILLRNCCLYAVAAWSFYVLLGFIVLGFDTLWNMHGLLYAANALVFTTCATTIAYLISRVVFSSGAINGIMNVVALGSSFLCGAFVPATYMPESVLAFAHILPSYYYIDANNQIMEIQDYDFETIWPIILNMIIVFGFSVAFVIAANIISKKKQRVA